MAILSGYRVSGLCVNGVPGGLFGLVFRSPMIRLNFTLPVAGPVTAVIDRTPQSCQEENDEIQLVIYVVDEDGYAVDLLASSSKEMHLIAPDGTTIKRAASFLTSGVDGALQYVTTKADLKNPGTYQLQARYVITGKIQTTRWAKFRVGENIDG